MTTYIGKVDHVNPSYAYVILQSDEAGGEDVLVQGGDMKGAIHEDCVEIMLLPNKRGKRRGRVLRVIERKHGRVVGNLRIDEGGGACCVPDHKRLYPIIIPNSEGKEGDKVLVSLLHFSSGHEKYVGEVVEVLGKVGDCEAERKSLSIHFGLEKKFDQSVEDEAKAFSPDFSTEVLNGRRDFCGVSTFTIDPNMSKDFDDAISLKRLKDGKFEIGIHVADVSYYVREGSHLDREALARGTSTYLVDKVVPMLPERLSNDLCSLRPGEKRLTFSVVVTFDGRRIVDTWLGEGVICSDKRFTYDEAHEVIEKGEGVFCEELTLLDELAKFLRKERMRKGAVDFATDNTEMFFDPVTQEIEIKRIKSMSTHQLIEEYMLLANRIVAERITQYYKKKGVKGPFIYRVHEEPKADKLASFKLFARHLGYAFDAKSPKKQAALNAVLKKSRGTAHEDAVQTLAIRTMEQARYTMAALGHFGLGFTYYTHFTSPIRRYPDVVVHRLLKHYLRRTEPPVKDYEAIARHSSQRERAATDAERASINLHQVLFLQKYVGKVFKGVITGVTFWGFYVEILENKCEGLVRVSDLTDDFYVFDATKLRLKGKRHKRMFQLGDMVTIVVKACDVQRKNVDFNLSE